MDYETSLHRETEDRSSFVYRTNARRIALELEQRFPQLRQAGQHCDFRADGHPERICGGVMYRQPPVENAPEPFVDTRPFDPKGPIEFKVIYGGWEKCLEGIGVLMGLQIEFTLTPPPRRGYPGSMTWLIKFTLPQYYQVPGNLSQIGR